LASYERYHLVLIDELGYIPFEREATDMLYQVISRRYECLGSFPTLDPLMSTLPSEIIPHLGMLTNGFSVQSTRARAFATGWIFRLRSVRRDGCAVTRLRSHSDLKRVTQRSFVHTSAASNSSPLVSFSIGQCAFPTVPSLTSAEAHTPCGVPFKGGGKVPTRIPFIAAELVAIFTPIKLISTFCARASTQMHRARRTRDARIARNMGQTQGEL
jgi:hypothetical protein